MNYLSANHRFIFVGPGKSKDFLNDLFYEVRMKKVTDAEYLEPYDFPNAFIKTCYKLCYSRKFRNIFRFLPTKIWDKYICYNRIQMKKNQTVYLCFIIGMDVNRLYRPEALKSIKKQYGDSVCLILLLFDSLGQSSRELTKNYNWNEITNCFVSYDRVATIDLEDAQKYGLIHITEPHFPREIPCANEISYDLSFVGVNKERYAALRKIADNASHAGLRCNFEVYGIKDRQAGNGIVSLKKIMPFDQVITLVQSAKCILEVIIDAQSSSTTRYYEAVVYNKKLLTNNRNIVNMPFYNPDYMQYFEDPDDIDYKWIKRDVFVNYGYGNEFSVSHMMQTLEQNYHEEGDTHEFKPRA